MPSVKACHVLAKGNHKQAERIAPDILKNGLQVNTSFFGTAVWAYYMDMVPSRFASAPMVIFEVDSMYVQDCPAPLPLNAPSYSFIKMPGPLFSYIPLKVLGFRNVSGQQQYQGMIRFI